MIQKRTTENSLNTKMTPQLCVHYIIIIAFVFSDLNNRFGTE